MFLFTTRYKWYTKGKFLYAWFEEAMDNKRLNVIVKEFFALSIRRLRLTPQACMAFFNREKADIPHTDMMKIRRLMLHKLFKGWNVEVCSTRPSSLALNKTTVTLTD